jgi:hypothetical protein
MSWALKNNMEYHSADIRSFRDYTPTYHGDVRVMNIPFEEYNVVWLSPSCVTWGRMAMSRKCRNPQTLEPITQRARDDTDVLDWIIDQLPRMKTWIIENPVGWMKRYLEMKVRGVQLVEANYCMYDSDFRKPTNFFSNISLKPCLKCRKRRGRTTCGKIHRIVGKGLKRPSLAEIHKIPEPLVHYLLDNTKE